MSPLRALVTAVRTLTILPAPGREAERLADALYCFPLVGGLLGLILYGLYAGLARLSAVAWPEGAAACVLAAGVILTGGIHLDGLADCADAAGCIREPEKALAAMKDPHVGAFGALALIVAVFIKWCALAHLFAQDIGLLLVGASIASRTAMVYVAAAHQYARPEGGTGGAFVASAGWRHFAVAAACGTLLLLALHGPAGAMMLAAGWLVAAALGGWYGRRLGGVTGDVLGACIEASETLLLLGCAIFGSRLAEYGGWPAILG